MSRHFRSGCEDLKCVGFKGWLAKRQPDLEWHPGKKHGQREKRYGRLYRPKQWVPEQEAKHCSAEPESVDGEDQPRDKPYDEETCTNEQNRPVNNQRKATVCKTMNSQAEPDQFNA